MKIQFTDPSPCFAPFIERYKYIETQLSGTSLAMPITSEELYFNNVDLRIYSPGYFDLRNPKVLITGLLDYNQKGYSKIESPTYGGGFGIVFKPGGFYRLFKIKSADFAKYAINGNLIFQNEILDIWEKLNDLHDIMPMKQIVEKSLNSYLQSADYKPDMAEQIMRMVKMTQGIISISRISAIMNTTIRTVERHVKYEMGLSLKEILQITRINRAITLIRNGFYDNLSDISYYCGYYDDSHFINDVKRITGYSPGTIRKNGSINSIKYGNRLFIK